MKTGVYPGTFDPITFGHIDVIQRARKIIDKLIVAVAADPPKDPMFALEERVAMVRQVTRQLRGVRVEVFEGLLVEYARRVKAQAIVRGLRAVSDFEYEFQMALMNRTIADDIETIFLMPSAEYSFVSSSMIREIAHLGGDLRPFVPADIARRVKEKFAT